MSQEPHRQDRHGLRLTDHSSVARFVNLVFYQSINPPPVLIIPLRSNGEADRRASAKTPAMDMPFLNGTLLPGSIWLISPSSFV